MCIRDSTLIDEIIKLVYPLTPLEHDELVEQMKRQWAEGTDNSIAEAARRHSG